jgi:hypothetical protein
MSLPLCWVLDPSDPSFLVSVVVPPSGIPSFFACSLYLPVHSASLCRLSVVYLVLSHVHHRRRIVLLRYSPLLPILPSELPICAFAPKNQ